MASEEVLQSCPACSHQYTVEGEHVPRTLSCLCTVCDQCIRIRQCEETRLECPLCGTENSIKNIRDNNYIRSRYLNEMANQAQKKKDSPAKGKKECSKHAREENLFCKECQTPICISCLGDDHEGHSFGDLEEETRGIYVGLMEDIHWMRGTLEQKKEDIEKVQGIVVEKCREGTSEVIARRDHLIREINQRTGNLLRDIEEQENKVRLGISKAFANIDEKLDLLKDFETIAKNKAIFRVETPKLVKFRHARDEIQFDFSRTTLYTVLTYMKCGDTTGCLSQLCGNLTPRNEEIGMEIEHVTEGPAASQKIDSKGTEQKISSDSSLHEKEALTAQITKVSVPNSNKRSSTLEETPVINGSHATDNLPVPNTIVKDVSIDQSDVGAEKLEGNTSQQENTYDDLLSRVNTLLEKTAKFLPIKNTAAPGVAHDSSRRPRSEGGTAGSRTTNIRGRNTALSGDENLRGSRKCTLHLYDRRDDVQIVAEPVAKKARLEATPNGDCQTNSQWPWQVVQSTNIGFEKLNVMDVLPNDSIVVSGKGSLSQPATRPDTRPKFVKFNRKTGDIVCNVLSEHTDMADGMAVFTTGDGSKRIALSYRERQVIEFYDVSNLRTPLHSCSVAPDHPGRLCVSTSSPGTLVYADCTPDKQVVRWLDCRRDPPVLKNTRTNIQVQLVDDHSIQDMCCVSFKKKDLLVTAQSYGGVYAYIGGTDNLKWHIGGYHRGIDKWLNAVGITTNGRGQLFVSDIGNKSIQMLSTNGTFLGTVLRRGLGNPQRIRWCNEANSLVIAHEKQGLFSIDVFQWLYSG